MASRFDMELKSIKKALKGRVTTAKKAVKAGEAAVKDAEKKGDKKRLAANKRNLASAKNALKELNIAFQATADACCNQRENCDPIFG